MAATTHRISRTFTIGAGSTAVDLLDAFGKDRAYYGTVIVTNLSPTSIVAVADKTGATAVLYGDDMIHIGPYGSREFGWDEAFAMIADAAGTRVEVTVR